MKYALILILMISCSSQQPQKVSSEAGSQGQAPSPYTLKPCYCMKIFQPVCADGQNFGNSCEAECKGHKTWSEGPCGAKKK
jgi:hypothetical protein